MIFTASHYWEAVLVAIFYHFVNKKTNVLH